MCGEQNDEDGRGGEKKDRKTEAKLNGQCKCGLRGCAKKKIQKIREYYGSGWVGPGIFFLKIIPK